MQPLEVTWALFFVLCTDQAVCVCVCFFECSKFGFRVTYEVCDRLGIAVRVFHWTSGKCARGVLLAAVE